MEIRVASAEDAEGIRRVYSYYVTDTAVSFEYDVPSVKEFERRIATTLEDHPYLVAVEDGAIIGYAYASHFKTRPAYSPSVETTVYIEKDHRGKGIGRKLYGAIGETLAKQNVALMCACIAYTDKEDPYLTNDSVGFHKHLGFEEYGRFPACAIKFGRPYGMLWMCRRLSVPSEERKFIPFSELQSSCD